jgi:uncharacterized peroxidase-related enzyme
MTWIRTIGYDDAEGRLRETYERIKGPDNNIDNIMLAHSLRPHTLNGHMTLYKYVLHHPDNELPTWYLEAIGVYVSFLNRCAYCFEHHLAGMRRLLKDEARGDEIRAAIVEGRLESAFEGRELLGLRYAALLTREPWRVSRGDIEKLRGAGLDDGEILEINQVSSYFAYANRMVLGLGIDTDGDVIGLSPGGSDDPDDWQHA